MSVRGGGASAPVLTLQSLAKSYERRRVLQDVTLRLEPGDLGLLLGWNGAGKSTLLRVIAGLSRADRGECSRPATLGYLGHRLQLYPALTVEENLRFFAQVQGLAAPLASLLAAWKLNTLAHRPVRQLSKGQQSRVALARAMLGRPSLLLLDEPTASLDELGSALLIERLKERHADAACATLVVTHDPARFESSVNRVLVLRDGRIAQDTRQDGLEAPAAIAQYRDRSVEAA